MMSFFKFGRKNDIDSKNHLTNDIDPYEKIGKIVKEARINNDLSVEDLSKISLIPISTITAIENNNKELIPQYPFLRSKLLKLEECLSIKNNTLTKLIKKNLSTFKPKSKFNLIKNLEFNKSFKGNIAYLLILLISILILNRYYLNSRIIEFKYINLDEKKI